MQPDIYRVELDNNGKFTEHKFDTKDQATTFYNKLIKQWADGEFHKDPNAIILSHGNLAVDRTGARDIERRRAATENSRQL